MSTDFLHGVEVVQIDDGLRSISTVKSSIIGFVGTAPDATADDYPLDTPVLISGPRAAAKLGASGTLKDAYMAAYAQGVTVMIVVRVAEGADAAATLAKVIGDSTAGSGIWALLAAGNITGQVPRILAAPGFTSNTDGAVSPVTSALISVAERLRSIVIADGPNTTEAAAIADAASYGSDRLYIVDPAVQVYDTTAKEYVTQPASGFAAGALSMRDQDKGFWWSPSNQVLSGITGTARAVSFVLSSTETEANRLNEAAVATIVRQDGYRLWGNRTPAADSQWVYLSVRRTADMIYESIESAMLWAMDRPFSAQLVRDIRDTVQAYLDTLIARGALLGGTCWLDPELNTQTTLAAGQLYLDFDIEPPAPLERLTFRAHRNGDYYEDLVSSVTSAS